MMKVMEFEMGMEVGLEKRLEWAGRMSFDMECLAGVVC
jgi:hypothetical protein